MSRLRSGRVVRRRLRIDLLAGEVRHHVAEHPVLLAGIKEGVRAGGLVHGRTMHPTRGRPQARQNISRTQLANREPQPGRDSPRSTGLSASAGSWLAP